MSKGTFEEYFAKKKELEDIVKGLGKTEIKKLFKEYFDAHPEVYGFEWVQYTPHFNDGDPCVFSVGECWTFKTKEVFEEGQTYDLPEESEGLVSEQYGDDEEPWSLISSIEEIVQEVFGDGVKVRVTRTKIEVEDYEHD